MKICNVHYIGGDYFFFKCHYLWPSNSLFRKYNQFGNITLSSALFWSLKKNFNYQIFCWVTYVTGCYSLTLPLSEGSHVAKSLQDIGLQEKYGLQNSPWGGGGKPYPASGLINFAAYILHVHFVNAEIVYWVKDNVIQQYGVVAKICGCFKFCAVTRTMSNFALNFRNNHKIYVI